MNRSYLRVFGIIFFLTSFSRADIRDCYQTYPVLFDVGAYAIEGFDVQPDWLVSYGGVPMPDTSAAIMHCLDAAQNDETGNAAVILSLALMWSSDPMETPMWIPLLRDAKDRGNKIAALVLADAVFHGVGVAPDQAFAFELYKQAADMGNVLAMHNVGAQQMLALGVPPNPQAAAAAYQRAVDAGYPKSAWSLARMYALGEGIQTDGSRALALLAAVQGYPAFEIPFYQAWVYVHGYPSVQRNLSLAQGYIGQVYGHLGDDNLVRLAKNHLPSGQDRQAPLFAFELIKFAANQGHQTAINYIEQIKSEQWSDVALRDGNLALSFAMAQHGNAHSTFHLAAGFQDTNPELSLFLALISLQQKTPGSANLVLTNMDRAQSIGLQAFTAEQQGALYLIHSLELTLSQGARALFFTPDQQKKVQTYLEATGQGDEAVWQSWEHDGLPYAVLMNAYVPDMLENKALNQFRAEHFDSLICDFETFRCSNARNSPSEDD